MRNFAKPLFAAAVLAASALGAGAAAAAAAPATYDVSYTFTSQYQVTNLNILVGDDGVGYAQSSYGYGPAGALTPDTIGIRGVRADFQRSFIFGVTQNLPGDAPGQQHLVLFTNTAFAQSAQDIAFGTLFPNTNEAALISYLETTPPPPGTFSIHDFAYGDAKSGPNGDLAFAPGDAFTEIAFSNGQIIGVGNGQSVVTPHIGPGPVSGAPEPAAWALMVLGVGFAGLGLRRRNSDRQVGIAATS